jgi:hypothetical protein
MQYLYGEKVFTCGLAKVLVHKKLGPQIANSQRVTREKVRKFNKLFKSASLRICDLLNLYIKSIIFIKAKEVPLRYTTVLLCTKTNAYFPPQRTHK